MKKSLIWGSLLVVLAVTLAGCTAKPKAKAKPMVKNPYEKSEMIMGTICTLSIYDKGKKDVINKGFKEIHHMDDESTLTRGGSQLDKINDNAGIKPVRVPDDFYPMVKKALSVSENSEGSFDMAIGAVTNLWKIGLPGARVPAQSEIDAALPLVDYHDVQLNDKEQTVYLTKKGMRLDFGGIAKGYIADQVKKVFKKNGVTSAIINLGGNIIVMGHSPEGHNKPWTVGIQNPVKPRGDAVGTIKESDMSVVTAGTYEQYLMSGGHKYIYLFDAKTGYPYENNLASVTIVSKKSIDGDALSNAAFDKGLKDGLAYMNQKKDIQAIFITNEKKIYVTDGLKKRFKLDASTGYTMGN
ncbi:FAD:protein FMN transferase [Furfurilactobacillus curtus]|uniref:FAD:protein FMN transferase n=1 Tax=Furfurilactobacillus curtus TaxID=1746200 RepID=A0ABQ5JLW0_9LACO